MEIIPLSEGAFTVDKTKVFVPFNKEADDLQERPMGSLLVEVQPFVIKVNGEIILLDTGLGFLQDGQLQLHKNLLQHNINPDEVTKVFMSHLHRDHSGGISFLNEKTGQRELSFKNAEYYVNENEMMYALEKGSPSYEVEDFELLQKEANINFIKGEGNIDNFIDYKETGGHSKFHQAFWIKDANGIAFFGGDVAPQLQQMKNKFIAKYDFDGRRSMELRQEWWEQGQKEDWTYLFYHDIKIPSYKK